MPGMTRGSGISHVTLHLIVAESHHWLEAGYRIAKQSNRLSHGAAFISHFIKDHN
jgi:hypothetical protein